MFHDFLKVRITAPLVVLFLLAACASGHLMKIGGDEKELPKDLPKELQEKFEVKESDGAGKSGDIAVTISPTISPTPEPRHFTKRARKQKPAPEAKAKTAKLKLPPVKAAAQEMPVPSPTPKPGFVYPVRKPEKPAIWVGEKQVYEMTYFGLSAGDFKVGVEPFKYVGGRKVFHIKGTAVSSSVFSLFYRLNDIVETYFDHDGIFSQRFHILLDESKQARDALELNDSEKGQTYYWNRWQKKDQPYIETKEFFPIQPFSQDSLSALYYLRSVPLPDGAVVTFPVINEGKTWDAVVTVLRREVIDSPMGKVRAVVLQPEAKYQGILKKQGDNFMWLTDDDRKFLLRLEAKVKIGTVVAKLKEVELGTPPVDTQASPTPVAGQ